MQNLKSFNGRKVECFSNDAEGYSYTPKEGEMFIFQHEESNGEFCKIDHFYICRIGEDGVEKCRWNATSSSISHIEWGLS